MGTSVEPEERPTQAEAQGNRRSAGAALLAPSITDVGSPRDSCGGRKTIGFCAGTLLLVNNITGPGVPALPNMFAEAGWLVPTICIILVSLATTVSAAMFCEGMRMLPGNEDFQGRAEYTGIVKHYFGKRWYLASQIGLNGTLQSLNVISIIQSAQIMDGLLSSVFGESCALNITPFQNVWRNSTGVALPVAGSTDIFSCIDLNDLSAGNGWGCHIVFSAGFLVTMVLVIPCGRWNLDDNMTIQVVAFVLTLVCWTVWALASAASLENGNGLHVVNTEPSVGSQAAVLGTVLFNFGFVTTVPSWVNEKQPGVSVNWTLWMATMGCIAVYFVIGVLGGVAFSDVLQGQVSNTCPRQLRDPSFNCPNDIMQVFSSPEFNAGVFVKTSVFVFPVVAVVSSIPVFSIVVKYNMIEAGASRGLAFVWGVLAPWAFALPLCYMPNSLAQVINFSSLIFVSFTDFIMPLMLYAVLHERQEITEQGTAGGQHHALPVSWRCSQAGKRRLARLIAVALSVASAVSILETVAQGSFSLDRQTCALVGGT